MVVPLENSPENIVIFREAEILLPPHGKQRVKQGCFRFTLVEIVNMMQDKLS